MATNKEIDLEIEKMVFQIVLTFAGIIVYIASLVFIYNIMAL